MATPKAKKRVRKAQVPQTNQCQPMSYRPSPTEQVKDLEARLREAHERTPIESIAQQVSYLVSEIENNRRNITEYELCLRVQREELNKNLLAHSTAIAKFQSLGTIPQPTI